VVGSLVWLVPVLVSDGSGSEIFSVNCGSALTSFVIGRVGARGVPALALFPAPPC